MDWNVAKIGTIYQKPAQAIGLSTPPIGCVLDFPGFPGGGNKIYDRSPYGNIGTITGATWTRLPSGLWVLDFDGIDDFVSCGSPASIPTNFATFAVEAWFKTSKTATAMGIIGRFVIPNYGWNLEIFTSGQLGIDIYNTAGAHFALAQTQSSVVDGQWHQGVGVWTLNTKLELFLDGVLVDSDISFDGTKVACGELRIGRLEGYFEGLIALPRIYNRAPSALEIQNYYNRKNRLFGVW